MQLRQELERLKAELRELKSRLKRDSETSNQPPSKDPPWKPKSERQKSERSSGGQRGHPGKTLKFSDEPDDIQPLPLTGQYKYNILKTNNSNFSSKVTFWLF